MEDTGSDYESSVEYRIEREKLNALMTATRTSKNKYNDDIDTFYRELGKLDPTSLLLDSYREQISKYLSRNDYSDEFDHAIGQISNSM